MPVSLSKITSLLLVLLLLSVPVLAESKSLLMRTPVELELVHHVTSKYSPTGTRVWLRVVDDVKVDGEIVVAEGTWAEGVVSDAEKAKSLGRGGSMAFDIRTVVAVDGTYIPLEGTIGSEGRQRSGATVGMVVGFGLLGLFAKGRYAYAMKGSYYTAYVAADREVKPGSAHAEKTQPEPAVGAATARVKPGKYVLQIEKGKKSKPIDITFDKPAKWTITAIDDMELPRPIQPIRGVGSNVTVFDGWDIVQYSNGGQVNLTLSGDSSVGRQEAEASFELVIKRKASGKG